MIRFVFLGTPDFAAIVLEEIIAAGLPPAMVITNPDKPAGRKKILTPPAAKKIALKHDIPVFQPEKISIENWKSEMPPADFAVVAAFAKILPQAIVEAPRLGTIGVHPSLLPKFRGATPIQSAILEGEKETGTALYLMDEKVDHGPLLAETRLPIHLDDTYQTLMTRLAHASGKLLAKTIPSFAEGRITPKPQDHSEATLTKKFSGNDGYVTVEKVRKALAGDPVLTTKLNLMIRALGTEPGVYTNLNGKRLKLLEGKIVNDRFMLTSIQFAGEKPKTVSWNELPYN